MKLYISYFVVYVIKQLFYLPFQICFEDVHKSIIYHSDKYIDFLTQYLFNRVIIKFQWGGMSFL